MSNPTSENPNLADSLLFEQFATLATAPDGIGRLRDLILQLAVQGRLGTQDAGDEPASVLLERIRKEKERLVKEGTIKKDKSLESVTASDVFFQIPNTWVLTRLGNIAQYNGEIKTAANEISEDAWVLDLEDIEKDTSRILQKLRFSDRQSLSTKSRFQKGDILYGKLRPYLNKVVVADEDGYCTTEIVPIRPYGKILSKYLMYALKTPDFLSYVNSKTYGIKMPRLGTVDALNTIIPLPPLAEQHRIVARVDRLMALCDELEARQQQERAGCLKLGNASFAGLQNAESPEEFGRQWAQVCDAFDLILDCPENVAALRQTILQLAVQGRLVKQDPGDEPANVLRKRLKQDTVLMPVCRTEIPFLVPDTWEWYHMVDICTSIVDCPHTTPIWTNNGYYCVRSADVKPGMIVFNSCRFVSKETYLERINRLKPQPGDIIYTREGTLGSAAVVPENMVLCLGQRLMLMRPAKYVDSDFLTLMLNSPLVLKMVEGFNLGSTVKHINVGSVKKFPIPLPPLAEQHRIVAKVDALMALCDQLEAQLKERAGMQGKFADAVVKSIGTG